MAEQAKKAVEEEVIKTYDYLAEDTKETGYEDMTNETMAIPWLKIIQKQTPELDKNKPEYIKGTEEGDMVNNLTKTNYGSLCQVVLLNFTRMYTEWKPDRGDFVTNHTVEHAEEIAASKVFGNWKTEDGNDLQECYMYLVLIVGHEDEGAMAFGMTSSKIKEAMKLNSVSKLKRYTTGAHAGEHILRQHQVYTLKTEYTTNEKGSWFAPKFDFYGVIEEVTFLASNKERKLLPTKKIDYAQLGNDKPKSSGDIAAETGDSRERPY